MRAALKWVGWSVVALLALAALANADKISATVFAAAGWLAYMVYGVGKQIESMHRDMTNRLERLYDRVEHVSQEVYALGREIDSVRRRGDDSRG